MFFRILSAVFFLGTACPAASPKAVVLVISDGTSLELLTASRVYGKGADGRLDLESLPRTAMVRTCSRSSIVTDSAAGATAMARGIKADNFVLGMESAKSKDGPPSLLDIARGAGWSTGVVTDDAVTGATPSAFLVEEENRNHGPQIAAKEIAQLGKRVDVLLGGGGGLFLEKDSAAEDREEVRRNERALKDSQAAWFSEWDSFQKFARSGDGRPALGIFEPGEFPFFADGRRSLRLVNLVEGAVTLLEAKGKPFLLVVEAGLPDKACHLNNAKRAMVEVGELDATIAWLRERLSGDSLLLVTTDHNTGGLSLNGQPIRREAKGDELLAANPVNGEQLFTWASGPGGDQEAANKGLRETDAAFVQQAVHERNSAMHSGGDVWLLGEGPGSEAVHGFLDNTDVYRIIKAAIEK